MAGYAAKVAVERCGWQPRYGWRKLIFRRWKIVYVIRGDNIVIGRVWPAAMGEADLKTPL